MTKLDAVIVDVDGTLALRNGRSPFDWALVSNDVPNLSVIRVLRALAATNAIVYVTGRDEVCRGATVKWISDFVGVQGPLFMRARGDNRQDSIIKKEILESNIRPDFSPWLVLDDRDQVVQMWRTNGLACFQVAPGAF